jgi:hydrogenase expression/formation protein HypC
MCLGIPGQIVAVDDPVRKLATVSVAGVKRQINTACIPDAQIGDWVLVHVGFAMSRIDEEQAAETLRILAEIGEAQAEMDAIQGAMRN